MEGRLYRLLLARHWPAIVILVAVCLGLGAAAYAFLPPRYQSTESFLVEAPSASSSPAEVYQGELLAQSRAQLYSTLVTGPTVATLVRDRVGGDLTQRRVQSDVSASNQQGSAVLDVVVTDGSAATATAIADAVARELPSYVRSLQSGTPAVTLRVVSEPAAARRVSPTLTGTFGLALLAGLVLGFLFAVFRELTNRRVRDVDDVRTVLAPAVVAVELRRRLPRRSREKAADRRLISLSVLFASAAAAGRPVALVPVPSTARMAAWAVELATRLSWFGERIGLVDADLEAHHLSSAAANRTTRHRPPRSALEDEGQIPGSVELMTADDVLAAMAANSPQDPHDSLTVELLGAAVMKVVSEVGGRSDVVFVMVGPVLLRSRPAFLSAERGEVLAVVERHRTRTEELRTAADVIKQLGSEIGAVVLVTSRRLPA